MAWKSLSYDPKGENFRCGCGNCVEEREILEMAEFVKKREIDLRKSKTMEARQQYENAT